MDANKYLLRHLSSVLPFTIILLSSFFILLNVSGCDNSNDPAPPPPAPPAPPAPPSPLGPVQVFLTSATYDGNLSGPDGADTACTTAATNAGRTGTWTAWLSDNSTAAVDRINPNGAPYELVGGLAGAAPGVVVANNWTDLTDGTLINPILKDESGNIAASEFDVWTATAADGSYPSSGACINWSTNDVLQRGRIGFATATDATWTDAGGGHTCNSSNRLYCFADAIGRP